MKDYHNQFEENFERHSGDEKRTNSHSKCIKIKFPLENTENMDYYSNPQDIPAFNENDHSQTHKQQIWKNTNLPVNHNSSIEDDTSRGANIFQASLKENHYSDYNVSNNFAADEKLNRDSEIANKKSFDEEKNWNLLPNMNFLPNDSQAFLEVGHTKFLIRTDFLEDENKLDNKQQFTVQNDQNCNDEKDLNVENESIETENEMEKKLDIELTNNQKIPKKKVKPLKFI